MISLRLSVQRVPTRGTSVMPVVIRLDPFLQTVCAEDVAAPVDHDGWVCRVEREGADCAFERGEGGEECLGSLGEWHVGFEMCVDWWD